jgi:hypothetical protein
MSENEEMSDMAVELTGEELRCNCSTNSQSR